MSAGDGFFTLNNSEIQNDIKTSSYCKDTDSHLIDNKGDSGESSKAWDNNFSERLANFMKNSKSLLENIDKKHNSVKFQNFENNGSKGKRSCNEPESPTHTLIELEETLMQIDDSKLRHIQKNDNKRTSESSSKINPVVKNISDNETNCMSSPNMMISSHNNIYFKPENGMCPISNISFKSDCNTLNSSLSFDHLDDAMNYDSMKVSDINSEKTNRHSRNMTFSGTTNVKGSTMSSITAFKLALCKKRANLLRTEPKIHESEINLNKQDQIGVINQVGERNKGFQNVINAIICQNNDLSSQCSLSHCQKSKTLSSRKKEIVDKDIDQLVSPFLSNDLQNDPEVIRRNCSLDDVLHENEKNTQDYNIINEISYLFSNLSQNNKKCVDKLSLSSKNSLVESSMKMKKWSNESLPVTSSLSISNIFVNTKLEKSEKVEKVVSAESNMSLFSSTCFKYSSPINRVSEVGQTSIDLNEKENISESNNTEKKISDSQSQKYIVNKNHNFQEALRIDELENEVNKMKSHQKEKDKKADVLPISGASVILGKECKTKFIIGKESKTNFKSIGTDVSTSYNEVPISTDKKQPQAYRETISVQKPFNEYMSNSSNILMDDDDNGSHSRLYNGQQEYSSIKDYNPNNSSALRNKIRDLESQIQDLQEANENASQIMSSLKQKSFIETSNSTHAMVSELVEKNKILREEVDRLHQSIPALKGDTISSQFLRQELENLKEDLHTLKQQNNLIVMENIALKNQLKKKENVVSLPIKYEDRNHVTNDHIKQNQSICNDTYELNNHSKDLSDSDDSICIPTNSVISHHQNKAMSMTNLAGNSNHLQKQPKKICKMLPQSNKKKMNHLSELYENDYSDNDVNTEEHITRITSDNSLYDKPALDISNDSTDSMLSDVNKEMQDIIFQSEVDNNIQLFSVKPKYEKTSENELQFEKSYSKSENKDFITEPSSLHLSKFSTLGRTAYAPHSTYDINIGDVVKFIRQGGRISRGLVHYVGPLPSRKDTYLGIELEIEDGKHDGIYEGKRYFQCIKNKGVFVAFNKIIMVYSRKI